MKNLAFKNQKNWHLKRQKLYMKLTLSNLIFFKLHQYCNDNETSTCANETLTFFSHQSSKTILGFNAK